MSLESQSGPLKSMKSLLPTQIFLQKRCFAPETRLVHQWGDGNLAKFDRTVVIQDLHFIAIPQRDPAVAVLGQAELDMQLEIPELLLGHDVLTTARGGQRTIFH